MASSPGNLRSMARKPSLTRAEQHWRVPTSVRSKPSTSRLLKAASAATRVTYLHALGEHNHSVVMHSRATKVRILSDTRIISGPLRSHVKRCRLAWAEPPSPRTSPARTSQAPTPAPYTAKRKDCCAWSGSPPCCANRRRPWFHRSYGENWRK